MNLPNKELTIPVKGELRLGPKEVDMVLELELEHKIFVDIILGGGGVDSVP